MMHKTIDELLEHLLQACVRPAFSRREIKRAIEDVLVWLTEHDTDANCRKVDLFVSTRIGMEVRDGLPKDVDEILFDMGGALHDTHTSPEVAENFWSTPQQLLERTRKLPD